MEATMPSYLVLYRSAVSPQDQIANATPEQAQAGMDAWTTWAEKAGPAIVDLGSPVAAVDSTSDSNGFLGGFSILQADSPDDLSAVLDGHPHTMQDGNTIESYEFLPIPGMG